MAFLRVRNCCCGCSLETGTKILAILGIIGAILNVLSSFGALAAGHIPISRVIGQIFGCIFGVLIHGMMLYAISKRKPVYLLPWLIISAIGLVLSILAVPVLIGVTIYLSVAQQDMTLVYIMIAVTVVVCFFLALNIYFFSVVYSYYHELKEEVDGAPTNAMYPVHNQKGAEEGRQGGYPPLYQEKHM